MALRASVDDGDRTDSSDDGQGSVGPLAGGWRVREQCPDEGDEAAVQPRCFADLLGAEVGSADDAAPSRLGERFRFVAEAAEPVQTQ